MRDNLLKLIFLFFLMLPLSLSSPLCAQEAVLHSKQDVSYTNQKDISSSYKVYEFKISYPKDAVTIDKSYKDNAEQLKQMEWFIKHVPEVGDSIIIYSYSSPEGPYWNNARLSRERGITAKNFLKSLFSDKSLADSIIFVNSTEENWEGLRGLVDQNYTLNDREKVLHILNSNLSSNSKKSSLKKVSNGQAWIYILENYMPQLRYATWIGKWQDSSNKLLELPQVKSQVSIHPVTQIHVYTPQLQFPKPNMVLDSVCTKTIIALKSNLLYDIATVLNFAIEVPFNEKFSILYEQHFPWWLTSSNKFCVQQLSFGGEFRWWFKPKTREATQKRARRDALVGHFLGVNVWGGKGDLQIGRSFGCYQYEFVSAGLTYGYAMPISKYLNLEFAISVGYANIPYRHYIPTEDWEILIKDPKKVGTLHYFGPTKIQVNLVLPIRMKRGGAR